MQKCNKGKGLTVSLLLKNIRQNLDILFILNMINIRLYYVFYLLSSTQA